eukprot:gnl/TRDRNA2_/TRDRNA2_178054_c0_seq1.p1 gnl/TRDRNA2_/TRDRNA2_178054_c0~~gnl/TRDRNA2_/TRDRNA2_178054_c0_seq1.p1  ORF type:complete len:106 (-),score=7.08 gnl/TRDRNA2_/TRDRNA2_178054_c0_seq1:23-340(-)
MVGIILPVVAPAIANANPMFMTPCSVNSSLCCCVDFANAANSNTSTRPAVVKAHAALARSWPLKSAACRSATAANDENSTASDLSAIANAQAVLARFCGSNSPDR